VAERLFARGCLWNSFVMVGRVGTFLAMMRRALPQLCEAMLANGESPDRLYAGVPSTNFSRTVLATRPANLAVLPVRGCAGATWALHGTYSKRFGGVAADRAWLDAGGDEVVREPA
jgi:hypothetical protein